jgi:hypothetical protein
MALDAATLKAEILKIIDPDNPEFVGWPADVATAAQNWADAFDAFASNAEDASGDALISGNAAGFKAAVQGGFAAQTAAGAAAGYGAGAIAYWTGAAFGVLELLDPLTEPCPSVGPGTKIFSIEASSVVTVPLAVALIAALTAEFIVLEADPDAKAEALADAFFDSSTTEITVLISGSDTTPPPSGPLPVTNTCTVF